MKSCKSVRLYARIPRARIGLLRFLFEGYGHAGIVSVVDRFQAVVLVRCTDDGESVARQILQDAGAEHIFQM